MYLNYLFNILLRNFVTSLVKRLRFQGSSAMILRRVNLKMNGQMRPQFNRDVVCKVSNFVCLQRTFTCSTNNTQYKLRRCSSDAGSRLQPCASLPLATFHNRHSVAQKSRCLQKSDYLSLYSIRTSP